VNRIEFVALFVVIAIVSTNISVIAYADFSEMTQLQNEGLRLDNYLVMVQFTQISQNNSTLFMFGSAPSPDWLAVVEYDLIFSLIVNQTLSVDYNGDGMYDEVLKIRNGTTDQQFVAVIGDFILYDADSIDWDYCNFEDCTQS